MASLLAEGRSVRAIAAVTRRKRNSVRWVLKQTYAKLGISGQSDLVRMICSVSGWAGGGE